jgi:hypothetical protein
MPALIERHDDEFVDRSAFLHLVLGLVRAGERVAAQITPAAEPPMLDARDERFVDAVVGLIAFTRDLRARVEASAAVAPPAPDTMAPSRARVPLR